MRHQVRIELPFEAAHRLMNHPGKCRYIHGHSYRAAVVVERMHLGVDGMVADFADLKKMIGTWIDENWDHNIILQERDPILNLWFEAGDVWAKQSQVEQAEEIFKGKKPFVLPQPPTAEVLSRTLYELAVHFVKRIDEGSYVVSTEIFETIKCSASTHARTS